MSAASLVKPNPPIPVPKSGITSQHVATISLLALGYSGYYFCRSDYSVALPLILAEQVRHGVAIHEAQIRLGSIASLGVLAYGVCKFPSGAIADIFGGRRNFLGGMIGSILFTILFMLGGGFPLFTLAWVGNRFIQALGWAGLVKVTSRWFSYSTYGTVMAILSLSYLFGDAISREIMSLLLACGFGWRAIFAAGAALLLLLLLLNLIFLRESPEACGLPAPIENPLNLFAGNEASPQKKELLEIVKPLVRSPSFWLICMISLGTTLLRETFNLWTPMYFTQFVGLNNAQAASSSALFPLCGGVSVLLAGVLSDYLGPEGRGRILFGGLCLTVITLLLLARVPAHAPSFEPILLVAAVAFLLIGPYSYLGGAMSLDFGGKEGSATASGLIDGVGYLAGVLSGNSMAHIAVNFGWSTMFTVLAVVAFISSAIAAASMWYQHQRRVTLAIHL